MKERIITLTSLLDIYDDDFFESLDGVTNALDNVEARKYLNKEE
jgi:molybdopterin/thiamine biosynthesis adenylyltransferase